MHLNTICAAIKPFSQCFYLLDVCVELEYLPFPLHLPHTDLTAELGHR